jgi:archaellum component FlaG (FlaF/FlaG flagellin family)
VQGIFTAKRKLSITTAVVALVIIGIALSLTTFAVITTSQTVSSTGAVSTSANLGVYSDNACTTSLSSVNWGNLTPGGITTQTIYVKNTGDLSLTLSMTTSSWSPASANGPITITWNQEGIRLSPGQSTTATLTLTVSSSIADITSFSVQINITGTN